MPELPEVETVVRTVAPRLLGREIRRARFYSRLVLRGDAARTAARLRSRRIQAVRRHGKFIVIELSGGLTLTIHLGMTGGLLWNAEPGPHARAVFDLDSGCLVYNDPRQFGRIELGTSLPERAARLGPDALAVGADEFAARLATRKGHIKPLLLNQAFLRGLGNIYADESLFDAGIHPLASAARLGPARVRRLYAAIQKVLRAAVEAGGSSVSDYVDADGRAGSFQVRHHVYGRAGEPCPRCGTPIRRIVVNQRGTHYCPRCQRA
jgi:formamidopyrimidine-DNA glycosylase